MHEFLYNENLRNKKRSEFILPIRSEFGGCRILLDLVDNMRIFLSVFLKNIYTADIFSA